MDELADLTEVERASVILMLLGDEEAAAILARLEPEELHMIGRTMCEMSDVGPDRIASAIGGFVQHANVRELAARDRPQKLREVMTRAVGEVKADSVMEQIAPATQGRTIEMARWLAPPVLVKLLANEHPQAVAVLLLLLDPAQAAQVLAGLPEAMQPLVVERVARCGPVSPFAVEMLNEMLEQGITRQFGAAALQLGGAREAADMINQAAGSVEKIVMPALGERDAELAAAIEAEMFRFTMLLTLSTKDIGRLLRDIDNDTLIDSLKGLEEPDRDVFFAAMSSRAAEGLKEEIEERGKIKRADVHLAQQKMIDAARKLADDGEIELSTGGAGGDDEFV